MGSDPSAHFLGVYLHVVSAVVTFLQTRSIISDYDRCLQIGGDFDDNPCKRSWGSLHPGGFNIVMCDGSTQFISESIDIFLFGAMSTIGGGEVVQPY